MFPVTKLCLAELGGEFDLLEGGGKKAENSSKNFFSCCGYSFSGLDGSQSNL